jgi:hypothetical protein
MQLGVALPLGDIGGNAATVREFEVWVSTAISAEADWREEFRFWKDAGVTRVTLNSMYNRNHHRRIAGRTMADHVETLQRYRTAAADLL